MQVWRAVEDVGAGLGRTVATVGNFDGVHRGHRYLLAQAERMASRLGGLPVVVVTFDPHPLTVVRPAAAPPLLTTVEQRLELLAEAGVAGALVLNFDEEMAHWSAEEFVQRVLVDGVNAAAVVVGERFRFGHRAAGDAELLARLGAQSGFETHALALHGGQDDEPDSGQPPYSSTRARQRLDQGDVRAAAEVLGRRFVVRGTVVEGEHRGRELGYPTANVPARADRVVPADGVYAGWLSWPDGAATRRLPAAISVGTNPTFNGVQRQVEAYVLDRDDLELYGLTVEVEFVERLRGQVRFDSVDDLCAQMAVDVDRTRVAVGDAEPAS